MILLQPCWILPKPTALFCMSENAVFCPTELSALIMKDNGKRKHVVRRALMPLDLGCPKQNHNPVVQFASHTPYLDDIFVLFLFCFCFVLTEKYFPAVFRQSDTISLWICQCDTNDRVETVQHSPTWWLFFLTRANSLPAGSNKTLFHGLQNINGTDQLEVEKEIIPQDKRILSYPSFVLTT